MKKIIFMAAFSCFIVPVYAGMPSVRLGYLATLRLEAISFFIVVFLLSSWLVKYLWNYALVDLLGVPKISYKRTLLLMVFWGMFFNLILTMISGARELMTPGAWVPQEITYALQNDLYEKEHMVQLRRKHIEDLRVALWKYADERNDSFPRHCYDEAISEVLWTTLHESGVRYQYIEYVKRSKPGAVLLFEPAILGKKRFVLFCDGTVDLLSNEAIAELISNNYFAEEKVKNGGN